MVKVHQILKFVLAEEHVPLSIHVLVLQDFSEVLVKTWNALAPNQANFQYAVAKVCAMQQTSAYAKQDTLVVHVNRTLALIYQ